MPSRCSAWRDETRRCWTIRRRSFITAQAAGGAGTSCKPERCMGSHASSIKWLLLQCSAAFFVLAKGLEDALPDFSDGLSGFFHADAHLHVHHRLPERAGDVVGRQ